MNQQTTRNKVAARVFGGLLILLVSMTGLLFIGLGFCADQLMPLLDELLEMEE